MKQLYTILCRIVITTLLPIVIDKNRIISGRYARLIDTGLLPN